MTKSHSYINWAPKELNYCIDCTHHYYFITPYERRRLCYHPSNILGTSLVDKHPLLKEGSCEDARGNSTSCGPSGSWFEPERAISRTVTSSQPILASRSGINSLATLKKIKAEDL